MVELIGEYWTDENGNKWLEEITSKDKAIEASKRLVDCYDCIDCFDCEKCENVCYSNHCVKSKNLDYYSYGFKR